MNAARLLPLALAASLAACSGGGASHNPLPGSPSTSQQAANRTASATIQIVVPLAGRTGATVSRKPQYVSPNTQSLGVTLTANNGTAIPVAQQQRQVINISSTSSQCTASGGTLTCTATIVVPVGDDSFSVVAYDGANGYGNILSQNQTVTATIAPTSANVVPMTLNGLVANITVSTTQVNGDLTTQPVPGTAQTIPVTVTAKDCSGATIVGPGSYVTPISLTLNQIPANPSTATLSETTVNGPSDVVTLAWNGSASTQYATITPAAMPPCGNLASSATAAYFLPRPVAPFLWASDSGGYHSANPSGGGGSFLIGYPLAWLHDVVSGQYARPGVAIFVAGLTTVDVAVDHAGNIYTDVNESNGPAIFKYAAGTTGASAPTQVIPSSVLLAADDPPNSPAGISSLASDPGGNLYVIRGFYFPASGMHNGDVLALSAGANYASASTFFHDTNNNILNNFDTDTLTVDANDNVFMVSQNQVSAASHQPALVLQLGTGGATNYQGFGLGHDANGDFSSSGLVPDGHGNLLVATLPPYLGDPHQQGMPTVTSYPYASVTSGSGTGTTLFTSPAGTSATARGPNAVARDAQGYIYLADNSGFVLVYAPGTSGSSAMPIGSLRDAFDPTTPTNQMVVPAGVPPPNYNLSAITAQI